LFALGAEKKDKDDCRF